MSRRRKRVSSAVGQMSKVRRPRGAASCLAHHLQEICGNIGKGLNTNVYFKLSQNSSQASAKSDQNHFTRPSSSDLTPSLRFPPSSQHFYLLVKSLILWCEQTYGSWLGVSHTGPNQWCHHSLQLFSSKLSSLAESTEELLSKCQGTSSPGFPSVWHLWNRSGTQRSQWSLHQSLLSVTNWVCPKSGPRAKCGTWAYLM